SRTIGTGAKFERNEQYFQGRVASFRTAELQLVPEATSRVQMLEVGETDVVMSIPPDQYKRSQSLSGVKVVSQPGSNDTYFAIPLKPADGLKQGPTYQL